jgi:AAHS family 4-hydroxybenzoate transporter-like MFS transporter
MPIGNFASGLIGSLVLPHLGWRALCAINGALALSVCLSLLIFVPESPRFLARIPHRRDALLRALKQMKIDVPKDAALTDGNAAQQKSPLSELFGTGSLGMTLGLWAGFFFCFLAAYTSLGWLPTLLSSHGYGLGVSSLALTASGVGGIFASFIMAKLIEVFGSRKAVIFPAVMAVLSTFTLSQMSLDPTQSAVPVLFVIGIMGLSLNSLTCFVYALGAFVYPPLVKGTGLGAAGAVGRIGAITSSYSAVAVLAIGREAYFGFIAASAVISMGFLFMIKRHIPSDKSFDEARAS